jgi:hypothetical protein
VRAAQIPGVEAVVSAYSYVTPSDPFSQDGLAFSAKERLREWTVEKPRSLATWTWIGQNDGTGRKRNEKF